MKKVGKPLRVVFVDDDADSLKEWRAAFKRAASNVDVAEEGPSEIQKSLQALDAARHTARKTGRVPSISKDNLFSDVDLVFVDYDLIGLENAGALTGEDIAYLLRCFSTCGFIVLLNPPELGTNFFDLTLRRSLDSWSDLVLGSEQLHNQWLWADQPSGFSPWSWPNLADAVARRGEQVKIAQKALATPVCQVLGIQDAAQMAMDHAMTAPISDGRPGTAKNKSKTKPYTLQDFVLKSPCGVKRKDNQKRQFQHAEAHIARIGAARLSSWLEHVVLPAQSVLVDAPHLVLRLPGLLAGEPSKLSAWNATTRRDQRTTLRAIEGPKVDQYRFKECCWLSRPAWYWPCIAGDDQYVEWAQVKNKMADVVFCEDTSSFERRSSAQEFMADVPAQFALRHVRRPTSRGKTTTPDYRPLVRLSM